MMAYSVNEPPFKYNHITSATTTTVKSSPGQLHAIVINTPGTTNTITIADASGNIGIITSPTEIGATVFYDVGFTSLSVTTSATCDLTVCYS